VPDPLPLTLVLTFFSFPFGAKDGLKGSASEMIDKKKYRTDNNAGNKQYKKCNGRKEGTGKILTRES
jgi:hypothetical protein